MNDEKKSGVPGQFTRASDEQRPPTSQKFGDHRDHKAPVKEEEHKQPDEGKKEDRPQSDEGQPSTR